MACCHVAALDPLTDGKRLLLSVFKFCTQDILDIMNAMDEFKGKIAVGDSRNRQRQLDTACNFDGSETKKLWQGCAWIPFEKTVRDLAMEWRSVNG